jgi:hypothetical protein
MSTTQSHWSVVVSSMECVLPLPYIYWHIQDQHYTVVHLCVPYTVTPVSCGIDNGAHTAMAPATIYIYISIYNDVRIKFHTT